MSRSYKKQNAAQVSPCGTMLISRTDRCAFRFWKVHQRAYKKYFARIRSGLMTKSEFEVWSRQAADLRDAALERYAQAESEEERQRIAQEVAEALNEA